MEKTFKALGDAQRREILKLLKKGSMNVGELSQHFAISDATLSYHLNILKAADLITEEKRGNYRYYSLHTSVFEELLGFFYDLSGKSEPVGKEKEDEK